MEYNGIQYDPLSDDGTTLSYNVHLQDGDVTVIVAIRDGFDSQRQLELTIEGLLN
jgi:hypothetical protein